MRGLTQPIQPETRSCLNDDQQPGRQRLLDVFASAEAIEELGRGRGRGHVEFSAQSGHARVVLPKSQLRLALSAVASHQPAMGVFPAAVTGQELQAHRDAAGVIT